MTEMNNEMNNRVKELRKALKLTQLEFAKKINRSQTVYSQYENGSATITDRTVADICREFNVNEEWLRTGNGVMFKQQLNINSMLSADVARLIMSSDDFTKRLVHTYLSLPDEAKQAVAEFLKKVVSESEEN